MCVSYVWQTMMFLAVLTVRNSTSRDGNIKTVSPAQVYLIAARSCSEAIDRARQFDVQYVREDSKGKECGARQILVAGIVLYAAASTSPCHPLTVRLARGASVRSVGIYQRYTCNRTQVECAARYCWSRRLRLIAPRSTTPYLAVLHRTALRRTALRRTAPHLIALNRAAPC